TVVMAPVKPPRRNRVRRTGANPWPIVAALVILIVIGTVIASRVASRDNGTTSSPPTGGSTGGGGAAVVHLGATTAYDPFGSPPGEEHNSSAPLATDGNGSTYWETERYFDAPRLNKPGVGLVLDAGEPVRLHQLGIATQTPGFVASIRTGDSP